MPEEIYINKEDCDLNIYILNSEETECGLCNYFYPNGNKYKLINNTGCISTIPINADFYNEKHNLLKCKTNYHPDNNECIPDFCYETCEKCFDISSDINDQKCLECKNGYYLQNNNCLPIQETTIIERSIPNTINNISTTFMINIPTTINLQNEYSSQSIINILCPEGTFLSSDNTCLNCPNLCKNYGCNICNCTLCQKGYYLDNNNICKKCEQSCSIYEENTCKCLNEYTFYGYYKGINESIFLLKTNNLTNVEDEIFQIIKTQLNNNEINSFYIESGFVFIVEAPKTKFIISKSDIKDDIITSIDLGECEDKLRFNKTISTNNSLYILYAEVEEDGMEVPRTEYEVYYKSDNNRFEKINLDICEGIKINKSVSINISDNDIDKYNSSSGYYNDICYTTTSENGTDITLVDRRKEYINNNMSLCEDNCQFIAYNSTTGKAICSCPISSSISHISGNKIDKEKLKSNFINFKNIANIEMLKCYRLLFSKNIIKNIGCIIISIIFIIGLLGLLIFYFYGYNLLKKIIKNIAVSKDFVNKDFNIIKDKLPEKIKSKEKKKDNDVEIFNNKNNKSDTKEKRKSKSSKRKSKRSSKIRNKSNYAPPRKSIKKNNSEKIDNIVDITHKSNNINNKTQNSMELLTFNDANLSQEKKLRLYNEIMKYNDTEINLLSYQEAIEIDQRNYCQYYSSLLKTRHLLIFSFCYNKDYNSRIIKIILFFFTFAVNYTINALFFNDSTMHKIYEDGGKFNFIYQIPQILYSSIISTILIMIVKMSALSEKNILKIKNSKPDELMKIYKSQSNCINCKFILFFIITFILLSMFWYYVGCFCAVYKNTQIHLITDTLISFITSLLYPLGLCLLPGMFRIPSLKNKEKNAECLYKASKIIQLFV